MDQLITDNQNVSLMTSFVEPKYYETSERLRILSMPKPQYHGKDFF
jgi:hypothetical protein